MSNNFLENTTSFSESEEPIQEAPQPPKPKKPVKLAKGHRAYNNFNISEEFLYSPDIQLTDLHSFIGHYIEIKIEKTFLTLDNKNVANGKIWGTDMYTSNSDPVAVIFHNNNISSMDIQKRSFEFLGVIFQVSKHKKNYNGSERNGVTSKKLTINTSNNLFNLKPVATKFFNNVKFDSIYKLACKMPIAPKRKIKMPPRRIKHNHNKRFDDLIFDMTNELAFKYEFVNIYDKSSDPKNYLSHLLTEYFMVIESEEQQKYILYLIKNEQLEFLERELVFGFGKAKDPYSFDNNFIAENRATLESHLEILYNDIMWSEVIWGSELIQVKEFQLQKPKCFKFYEYE